MPPPTSITCKPTSWFIYRALIILLMLGVLSVYFYYDGSVGYRNKNKVFYLYKTFEAAGNQFAAMNSDGELTESAWNEYAKAQSVNFPENKSILPENLELPMPWPNILCDYYRMKSLQWNQLWLEYSGENQLPEVPSEHVYDARKIQEQWTFVWICSALTLLTAVILLRTLRRSITADSDGITSHKGTRIPYDAMKTLDLRKWKSKGLAFIEYESQGRGRIRVDGLTYGGFKKDQGAPAEKLMEIIRDHFSGEIIEYAEISPEIAADDSESESKS